MNTKQNTESRTRLWSLLFLGLLGGYGLTALPVMAAPFAYVTNAGSSNVSVIDTTTNAVVGTIAVGVGPQGVAITPDGKHAYVTNANFNNVSVIDTTANAVVETIVVGMGPWGVAITPDGTRVYVADGNVSVIDTTTNAVVSTIAIAVGMVPQGMAITPDGKHAYVTDISNGNVLVINTTTNAIVSTIAVGGFPTAVAITPKPCIVTSAFNVKPLIIDQNRGALFLWSNFALGQDSNINPVKEDVTLKIDNFTLTIPAGSFHKNSDPPFFAFAGQIDNVWIEELITPLGGNRFGFQALAYGAPLGDTKNPVTVELTIGDDCGTTTANARTH